jgi:hypothetical protein
MRSPALDAITASPCGNSKSRAATSQYVIKLSIASWLEQISSASSRARYGTLLGPFVSSGNHYVLAI